MSLPSPSPARPRLAAFPKCFMDALCVSRTMTLAQWIDLGADLDVDGLELYPDFFPDFSDATIAAVARQLRQRRLAMPMFCVSPDFTQPDPERRRWEIARYREWLRVAAALGAETCRVLSGQRRPTLTDHLVLDWASEAIASLLPDAERLGVRLALENHYKDNYWTEPEFAQSTTLFCALLDRLPSPWLGVQFDPSNAYLAGEDPLALLRRVAPRVISVHASDRFLRPGHTLAELRQAPPAAGYAAILQHGEVGQGLNDFDALFRLLHEHGFHGWVSIEDGVDGLAQLQSSVQFVRSKLLFWFPPM